MAVALDLSLRPVRAEDFQALVELATSSPDSGAIRVAPRYLVNPVEAWSALKPELEWVVAESDDRLIGAGQVIFGETVVEGERFPCACLSSLMVHPDYRRRGVAGEITAWRLERAGSESVIMAAIQAGNVASMANARKWATQVFGKVALPIFRAKATQPGKRPIEIREPQSDDEWEAAAEGLAAYERGWNLRTPETGSSLRERSARMLAGERLQRYYVAIDHGAVVGGYELFVRAKLQTAVFERLPAALRALNVLLRVVPADGELRLNSVSRFWHASAEDTVGRALWAHASSIAGDEGNAIGTQFDARSPLRRLLRVKPWTPSGSLTVAVRSPVHLSEERLLLPP